MTSSETLFLFLCRTIHLSPPTFWHLCRLWFDRVFGLFLRQPLCRLLFVLIFAHKQKQGNTNMQNKRKHNKNKLRQKHMYRVYRYVVDSLKCCHRCKMYSCKCPRNCFSTFLKKFFYSKSNLCIWIKESYFFHTQTYIFHI